MPTEPFHNGGPGIKVEITPGPNLSNITYEVLVLTEDDLPPAFPSKRRKERPLLWWVPGPVANRLMDVTAWWDRDVWGIPPQPKSKDEFVQFDWHFRVNAKLAAGWRPRRYV